MINNWVTHTISGLGYLGLIFVMALENVFPPIPSEAVMPFAGFLTVSGRLNFVLVVLSGILGSLLGALILYYIGYFFRGARVRRFLRHWGRFIFITEEDLNAAEQWFNRYGEWGVLFARMVPIVRSIVSVPAGFIKMSMLKFMILTLVGVSIWTFLLAFLGVILGKNWKLVSVYIQRFEKVIIGLIIFLTITYFYRKISSYKNKKKEDNIYK